MTDLASGDVTHRYHVRSPERVIAIVTRAPRETKIAYLQTITSARWIPSPMKQAR
ncbi:MAG: hypothetical protein R3B70_28425 [Polyangiaceae bacterium]